MKLHWDTRINLRDLDVLLHQKSTDTAPRVTIGLPTYRRGHVIRRALASIAAQSYKHFVLIISDNNGQDRETMAAVGEYANTFPEVVLVAQKENIGALQNLKFLLAAAQTEFFMWIADDDEISTDYLEELVGLLDAAPDAVSAVGKWLHMTSLTEGSIRPQIRLESMQRLNRLFKFVAGKADDSAFYGVHRTDCLRQSHFDSYLPPNRGVLTNFCYLVLFDMLCFGRFRYGQSATWICHVYSEKEYNRALGRGVTDRIKTLLRRLNIYALYISKTARNVPMLIPVVTFASIVGFTQDVIIAFFRLSLRAIKGWMQSVSL